MTGGLAPGASLGPDAILSRLGWARAAPPPLAVIFASYGAIAP